MPDDRESPSGGWRAVYDEMGADAGVEEPTHSCPDCGRTCENVLRDVYECEEHGIFRASASDDGETRADRSDAPETEDADDVTNRARGTAD